LITNARIFDQNGAPLRLGNSYCTDEFGNYTEMPTLTYPHCPERDPFRAPSAAASLAPETGGVPGAPGTNGPGPVPSQEDGARVSPSVGPAPSGSPAPAPSAGSVSPSPR
jgi:hypothetical protein